MRNMALKNHIEDTCLQMEGEAKRQDVSLILTGNAHVSNLKYSTFCLYLSMATKVIRASIWGLQVSFSQQVNSSIWNAPISGIDCTSWKSHLLFILVSLFLQMSVVLTMGFGALLIQIIFRNILMDLLCAHFYIWDLFLICK